MIPNDDGIKPCYVFGKCSCVLRKVLPIQSNGIYCYANIFDCVVDVIYTNIYAFALLRGPYPGYAELT